jgi:hypothetical protein
MCKGPLHNFAPQLDSTRLWISQANYYYKKKD